MNYEVLDVCNFFGLGSLKCNSEEIVLGGNGLHPMSPISGGFSWKIATCSASVMLPKEIADLVWREMCMVNCKSLISSETD